MEKRPGAYSKTKHEAKLKQELTKQPTTLSPPKRFAITIDLSVSFHDVRHSSCKPEQVEGILCNTLFKCTIIQEKGAFTHTLRSALRVHSGLR
jgi:hypothetical protein